MKYKKVIIFLTLVLGAVVLCRAGSRSEKVRAAVGTGREVQAASGGRVAVESEKIAVVNLDEGVQSGGRQINYASELSRFPTMDFEYSSLEAARTGLETGRYGAYVIIPAVFSQNVESINEAPQVSQLEYAVNRSYSGELQYELLYNVQSYMDSLNNRLSYMYVDNILKEFHKAQDGAGSIMENDLRDKEVIEKIKAQDLVALTELPEFQMEENTAETPDLSVYAEKNTILTAAMNEEYARNVQGIREEIASLSADGTALAEQLNGLSGQIPKMDLTVDGNGESILETADTRFQDELKRQSECTLEKEKVAGYLRKLLEDHEEFRESWRQGEGQGGQLEPPGGQPEQPGNQPDSSAGQPGQPGEPSDSSGGQPEPPDQSEPSDQPEQSGGKPDQSGLSGQSEPSEPPGYTEEQLRKLTAWLEEEDQGIRNFLEEVEQTEDLDVARISELAKAEYAEPLISKAEETGQIFRQRYEDEVAAIASYNGRLSKFRPQLDDRFISQNIGEMNANHTLMQDILFKNNQAYKEYARRSADSAREYGQGLQKHVEEAQKKSEEAIAEGLSEAQKTKKETSFANQRILRDFASKLPYTRIGDAENVQVYQFVADPLEAKDHSDRLGKSNSPDKKEEASSVRLPEQAPGGAVSDDPDNKRSSGLAAYGAAGIVLLVLTAQGYIFLRRKKDYEY
ncbi:hypothetical protein C817_00900 [Dorea sp. 5-2]|nr:hypothetical protein C817_00900 [Dorea sp. 5-2]